MELPQKQTIESTTALHQNDSVEDLAAEPETQSIKEKIISTLKLITVEPVYLLYLFSMSLAGGAVQKMPFEMACRVNKQLNDTICFDITIGQKYTSVLLSSMFAWATPLSTTIVAFLALCFAAFSDRYKVRKPFFILPLLGEVFCCIGLILCGIFISQWPVEVYFIMSIILPACFGGGPTLYMSIVSYISDISTEEERTSRIGFVEICGMVIYPIGTAISGIFFHYVGYYIVNATCLILFTFAILYGIKYIKETKMPVKRDKNICVDIFNVKAVIVDMFKILFRKRIAYRRKLLILSYICYILLRGPVIGVDQFYQYYGNEVLKMDIAIYQYYTAFDQIVQALGVTLAVTVFTKKLKLNDIIIAIIACIFMIIAGCWYAFCQNEIMFWIGPIISSFGGLFMLTLRSFVTKLVDTCEIAKTQALFAVCEAICPTIYLQIYPMLHAATKDTFYGAVFLLTSVLVTPALLILLIMYSMNKKDVDNFEPEPQNEKQTEENDKDIEIERF